MKNIENMTMLNDMVLARVAGGDDDDDRTIVDVFIDWLLSPPKDDSRRSLPLPQTK